MKRFIEAKKKLKKKKLKTKKKKEKETVKKKKKPIKKKKKVIKKKPIKKKPIKKKAIKKKGKDTKKKKSAKKKPIRNIRQHKAQKLLKKTWKEASVREKARFLAKYIWNSDKKAWDIRKRRKKVGDVMEKLKQKGGKKSAKKKKKEAKTGKGTPKEKAKKVTKKKKTVKKKKKQTKAEVIKANAARQVVAAPKPVSLFIDLTNVDKPLNVLMKEVLRGAKPAGMPVDYQKELRVYFAKPAKTEAFKLGKDPLILITEDTGGMYSIEAYSNIIKKIESAYQKVASKYDFEPNSSISLYKDDPKHVKSLNEALQALGGVDTKTEAADDFLSSKLQDLMKEIKEQGGSIDKETFVREAAKKLNLPENKAAELFELVMSYVEAVVGKKDPRDDLYIGAKVKILRGRFKNKIGKVVDLSVEDDQVDVKIGGTTRYLGFDDVQLAEAAWETLPKGWTEESLNSFWNSLTGDRKHKITACMKKMEGKIDNPGAFCASLARRLGEASVLGYYLSKKKKTTVKEALLTIYREAKAWSDDIDMWEDDPKGNKELRATAKKLQKWIKAIIQKLPKNILNDALFDQDSDLWIAVERGMWWQTSDGWDTWDDAKEEVIEPVEELLRDFEDLA
jgi:hypothetical protein